MEPVKLLEVSSPPADIAARLRSVDAIFLQNEYLDFHQERV